MRVGVVEVMAKVIEFYAPDRLRERRLRNSPEQRGKVIEFPSTEITGVTSELNGAKPLLVPWARKENDPEQVLSGSIPSR
jgi:hypothetical protein